MKDRDKKNIKTCRKITEIVTEMLDIPEELLKNMTKVSTISNKKIVIDGFKQIIDFSSNNITIKCKDITIEILGNELDIKQMQDENICIVGKIEELLYKK